MTAYRFLPWSRQGLATRLATPDPLDDTLPARAGLPVRVRINAGAPAGVDVSLYGPGDIVGVDPRGIVRTDPVRHATDAEANMLAAIEFDRPDFPWMFTPAAADGRDRLRPWCVLVVLAADDVDVRVDRARPLPTVMAPVDQLPPLAESWAWAHAQVLTEQGSTGAVVATMRDQPDLAVSRILCPRRLVPTTRWVACLVPAFAAGVRAGLGQAGDDDVLAAAWDGTGDRVLLPVYHHWEFATGPAGDFESLARRLAPPSEPLRVGTTRMAVDRADPALPELPEGARVVDLEGALVGPLHPMSDPLADLDPDWAVALADLVDVPAASVAEPDDDGGPRGGTPGGDADEAVPAVTPPLYGQWPAGVHHVPDQQPRWLREVNLAPGLRATAGLGVEVVRANQEDLVHDAWAQVGDVLGVGGLLDRARFSREVGARLHRRLLVDATRETVFRVAAPLHHRVLVDGTSVAARLRTSRVPTAAASPALRRLGAPGGRIVRRAANRAGTDGEPGGPAARLVARLDDGDLPVTPATLTPDGVSGARAIAALRIPTSGTVDLAPIGGRRPVDARVLNELRAKGGPGRIPDPSRLLLRKDLGTKGPILRGTLAQGPATTGTLAQGLLGRFDDLAGRPPGGTAAPRPRPDGGTGVPRPRPPGGGTTPPPRPPGGGTTTPPPRPPGGTGPPEPRPPTDTKAVLARLQAAFDAHLATIDEEPDAPVAPALGLAGMVDGVVSAVDPRSVVPSRVAAMIRIDRPGAPAGRAPAGPDLVEPRPDLAGLVGHPVLRRPMYEPLAALAPERLLPGIAGIPTNTVALLRTNPRFVTAFLVGANGEFAGELLWRSYPARRDATTMRRFWDRADGGPDIPDLRDMDPAGGLDQAGAAGSEGDVVVLVRGDLLRRYPTASVYLVQATAGDEPGTRPQDHRHPVFQGRIGPDVTFLGFDLGVDDVIGPPGWFVMLQQQPTEPRFGFDVPVAGEGPPATWRDATWDHVLVAPGRHLTVDADVVEPADPGDASFVAHAGHLAAIALQQPVRVAIHARDLLGTEVADA